MSPLMQILAGIIAGVWGVFLVAFGAALYLAGKQNYKDRE